MKHRSDEFDFMARKVTDALIETAYVFDGMKEPFRSGAIAAVEEVYFRLCGKHLDWENVKYALTECKKGASK